MSTHITMHVFPQVSYDKYSSLPLLDFYELSPSMFNYTI